jgi:hypothetical protein
MKHIIYAATEYGYTVQIIEGSEVKDEFNFGNHRKDSTVTLDNLASKDCLPPHMLEKFAQLTAHEIGKERGITSIEHDDDLETTLKERDRG